MEESPLDSKESIIMGYKMSIIDILWDLEMEFIPFLIKKKSWIIFNGDRHSPEEQKNRG